MAALGVEVSLHGKIKDPGLKELGVQAKVAVAAGLLELATIEGQVPVQKHIRASVKKYTGNLSAHIGAAMVGPLTAQFDAGEKRYRKNLIYSYWIEGISSRNKTSTFKGYGMFSKAYNDLTSKPSLWKKYVGERLMRAFE